jgi:hypothetical protein
MPPEVKRRITHADPADNTCTNPGSQQRGAAIHTAALKGTAHSLIGYFKSTVHAPGHRQIRVFLKGSLKCFHRYGGSKSSIMMPAHTITHQCKYTVRIKPDRVGVLLFGAHSNPLYSLGNHELEVQLAQYAHFSKTKRQKVIAWHVLL